MNENRFFLDFGLFHAHTIISPSRLSDLLATQIRMEKWCLERLGKHGFPHWQFSETYVTTLSLTSVELVNVSVHRGIYIFDDEARTAFKLTFLV